jgi:hypothetical protein
MIKTENLDHILHRLVITSTEEEFSDNIDVKLRVLKGKAELEALKMVANGALERTVTADCKSCKEVNPDRKEANGLLIWKDADRVYGPKKTGFCILVDHSFRGIQMFHNVKFCPECGRRLEV